MQRFSRRAGVSGCCAAAYVMITLFSGNAGAGNPEAGQAAPPQDEQDAATSEARELFKEGTERAHRGDWSQALLTFERSSALHPHAVTTYNIGYCERALGRYTRARKMLGKALAENAAHGGLELPDALATAAGTYLAEVERQIARAVVSLSPEGASVLVDGRPLERAVADGPQPVLWAGTRELGPTEPTPASTFELQLDPGAHVFAVSKAGYWDNVTTRSFEPGVDGNIVIQLSPVAAPSAPNAKPGVASRNAAPSRTQKILALVAGGSGAIGLGVGGVFGFMTISAWTSAKRACGGDPSQCIDVPTGQSYRRTAQGDATISTISFIAGGVLLAGGAGLLVTASSPNRGMATGLLVTPSVGPGRAGLAMSGAF